MHSLHACIPHTAVVLSPSQDSFYNALPGLITVEEGGATPSSQTDHLMNTYFQPPLLQNEQRRNGNTKHRVHLQTSAIATPPIATASLRVGTEGNRMGDTCTTTKEPSTTAGELAQHHTLHSALPISPGELSAKEASTVKILSSDDRQSTPTGEGRMDEHNNQFLFPQPVEQRDVSSGPSKANRPVGEMNYKQLMQRSISQGMPGIMNKVIYESKHGNVVLTSAQNPTSTESSSASETTKIATDSPKEQTASVQPSLSHVKPLCHSPGIGMGSYSTGIESDKRGGNEKLQVISESTKLRTLVCSPMEAASRKFPEFVFAPGTTPASSSVCSTSGDLRTNSAEITTGGDVGDENQIHNSQIVQSNVSMSTVTVNEGRKGGTHSGGSGEKPVDGSKCDTKSKRLARKLEFNYEGDQVYAKSKSHLKTKICDQSSRELQDGATAASYDQLGPCGHHSRSVVPVTAETTLTISFKYHSRASLYPSFLRSAYYSTEMDIMESLHTLLDMKFKERVQEKGHRSARVAGGNHPVPTTESLMDEARRSHLIFSKETPKKAANVSLKRPHSFHYRRTKSEVNSAESANLESPIKREFLLRKAAEAVNQRKKKSFSEKESNLDALVEEQRSKPQRVKMTAMVHTGIGQSPRGSQGSQGSNNDYAKSMENLTMSDARYSGTIPESSPYTQKQLSSSSYSLHALPSRHVSFRESSSSQRTNSQRRALPKRSKSFHESSKSSQSLEALHVKSDLLREEGDEELLYTFERRKRPVTVLVRSNSSLAVHNGQTSAEAKLLPPRTKYQPSSNLMTTKARSSQGLALYETTEDRSCNHSVLEGSQKRYSRNRPTSAPSERPSHSRDQDRESSGLDGLMSSIHLKADKLWWNEL